MQDYDQLRKRLTELRETGQTAGQIAATLNAEGFQTARGKKFESITVQTLLFRSDITADKDTLTGKEFLPEANRWSIPQLVKELDVPTTTLCHWCRRGWLQAVKTRSNRWVIWDEEEIERLGKLSAHQRANPSIAYPPDLTMPKPLETG